MMAVYVFGSCCHFFCQQLSVLPAAAFRFISNSIPFNQQQLSIFSAAAENED